MFLLSFLQSYTDVRWKQSATTIAGGNGEGNQLDQLDCPHGICIDDTDQTIYIADRDNARILAWRFNSQTGQTVTGGKGQGNRLDQLNNPTDVIIDRHNNALVIADQGNRRIIQWPCQADSQGKIIVSDIDCARLTMHRDGTLYVSDNVKNEVKQWTKGETLGTVVAGGNGPGNRLNQLCFPTHFFVDDDHNLYISDRDNHRVMKWMKDAKEGIVVAGGNGQGNQTAQLSFPQGVLVDQFGNIYVADHGNGRVMRWGEGEKEGTIVVGDKEQGERADQLSYPVGLLFDSEGDLYVTDYGNNRIQRFHCDEI